MLITTIPGREAMLEECLASVEAQTLAPEETHVLLDDSRSCQSGLRLNELAGRTDCEWLAPFADDDLMKPTYLEQLAEHAGEADIIYADCEVTGRDWCPNGPFDPSTLHIPAAALIRRSVWEAVKGWGRETRAEDGAFWRKAYEKGARFHRVPEELWVYRFHGHNKSLFSERQDFWESAEG